MADTAAQPVTDEQIQALVQQLREQDPPLDPWNVIAVLVSDNIAMAEAEARLRNRAVTAEWQLFEVTHPEAVSILAAQRGN